MNILLLLGAGVGAGMMNALAGGGTFLTLPALMAVGAPAVSANASGTVALIPGLVASAWVHRGEVRPVGSLTIDHLLVASLAGGVLGAVLLLVTPAAAFERFVPWLALAASATLWLGPSVRRSLERLSLRLPRRSALAIQAVLGVYGGYFGAGVGFMVLALWTLAADLDVKAATPARILTSLAMNGAAAMCFAFAGIVEWPETLILLGGAVTGGIIGSRVGRRLPQPIARAAVVLISSATTVLMFVRGPGP